MNYFIKGRKYLMFVGLRRDQYLEGKLRISSTLFIYLFIYYIDIIYSFKYSFSILYANFILSRSLLINNM